MRPALLLILGLTLTWLSACSGGGGSTTPPVASILFGVARSTGGAVVYGPPGSADASSEAVITAGGQGTAIVARDGSFVIDVTEAAGSSVHGASALTTVTVTYKKKNVSFNTNVDVTKGLQDRVTAGAFVTGSAPNDMAAGNQSLYICNSLDNTVSRYSYTGIELADYTLPEYSSPSYLALGGNAVWIVNNGTNIVTGQDDQDFSDIASTTFQIESPGMAFIAPAQPIVIGTDVFVPRGEIESFSPETTYATGKVSQLSFHNGQVSEFSTTGKNPQYTAYDNLRGYLYVVSAGEVLFDNQFHPYVNSDSYLEVFDVDNNNEKLHTVNLGRIGAGRLALSPNGSMGYMGNSLNGNVYKVDLVNFQLLRGLEDPIELTTEFTYVSDLEFSPDGRYLFAVSFNTDELYAIDPDSDEINPAPYIEPVNVSQDPNLMAGAAGLEIVTETGSQSDYDAYVLLGIANAVTKVDLF